MKPLKTHLYWLKFQNWWLAFIITITGRTITYKWRAFSEISLVYHMSLLYSSTACLLPSKCWSSSPEMRASIFMFMMDFCITLRDLAKLNSNFLIQSSYVFMFAGWGIGALSLSVTSKQRNHMGCSQVSRGPRCPPSSTWWQASCPGRWCLAISSPSWPGVAWHHLAVTQFSWTWTAPGSASWQGRPCPPAAACSWTGWPSANQNRFCYIFMNISAKDAARIKIKYSFAIYMDGAYQKCLNFVYCRSSWSCEINKKQSRNSLAGHPIFIHIHNTRVWKEFIYILATWIFGTFLYSLWEML